VKDGFASDEKQVPHRAFDSFRNDIDEGYKARVPHRRFAPIRNDIKKSDGSE
jgi:hypothetical protein